ncbi:Enoyl-CoA hydratase/carnithine racemase [Nocardia amikacinitolerans]|uniref:enoyl-CoA hydratase-related protein n=1 Tax=Nocardia amikacinitolerans TaxID=756689 RepID=UPI00083620F2|nr:enoyl-CoA hydratase-related protein [Nocardia amikacinitolerans]MCP2315108.1 Enoyl-CoA hydratase/carnithine racemase [Nocardia amikacinitolerans]
MIERSPAAECREPVLAERRGPVLVLTLNRPERLNAWTDELERRYFELLDEAEADPDVRAIVVTGAGRGFCAGADMDDLHEASTADDLRPVQRPRPRAFPLTVRKPMIAAINGAAAGLGLVEALYCDLRFSTPEAKLTTAFVRRGLIAEYGIAWLLPRLIGPSRALDLLLSGRVITGEEAQRIGLVDRVVDSANLLTAAIDYATELAQFSSPTSMSVIKEQVYQGLDIDFDTAVRVADRLMVESFRHPDAAEGVRSYLEKRAPAFQALDVK